MQNVDIIQNAGDVLVSLSKIDFEIDIFYLRFLWWIFE